MLAYQANKCAAALVLVLAIAGLCQADFVPDEEEEGKYTQDNDDDYQDDMTRAVAIVYAGKSKQLAGFERTQRALVTILNQLNAPDVRKMQLPEELLDAKRLAATYLDYCELSRPKCDLVSAKLDEIKRVNLLEDSINQLPFLQVCERAHQKFCDGSGSDESAKKRVWHELKKQVAREEAAARKPSEAQAEAEDAGKKNIWNKIFPKHAN